MPEPLDPGRRLYPDRPLVGVGAAVVDRGRLVLVRRANDPGRGQWGLPGGLVHLGEELATAVRREVLEECGLEVRPGEVLAVLDNIVPDRGGRVRYHYVIVDFIAYPEGGSLKPGTDVLDARWVPIVDLPRWPLPPFTRGFLERWGGRIAAAAGGLNGHPGGKVPDRR